MEDGSHSILLISESDQEAAHICEAVVEKGWSVQTTADLGAAETNLNWSDYNTLVVDLVREDGSGLELLDEVRAQVASSVTIVVVASMADKLMLMQALERGATDFLWRGASALDIQARLSTALKLGALQEELRAVGRVDALTGTHHKDYIMELLEREFERSRRYKRPISCLLLDIDGFEQLSATHESNCVRDILVICSKALKDTLRNVDEISRFRESIFLVLMPETSASNSVMGLARVRDQISRVQASVSRALGEADGQEAGFQLSVTAGIATYPDDGLNSHADLIMAAETALYEAKRKGPGETVRADFQ